MLTSSTLHSLGVQRNHLFGTSKGGRPSFSLNPSARPPAHSSRVWHPSTWPRSPPQPQGHPLSQWLLSWSLATRRGGKHTLRKPSETDLTLKTVPVRANIIPPKTQFVKKPRLKNMEVYCRTLDRTMDTSSITHDFNLKMAPSKILPIMTLSFVSSFHFLPFLFQFQQHISQFLRGLESTKESLWLAPPAHSVPQCKGPRGEGAPGLPRAASARCKAPWPPWPASEWLHSC